MSHHLLLSKFVNDLGEESRTYSHPSRTISLFFSQASSFYLLFLVELLICVMYSNYIEMLHDYERSTGNCRQSDAERLAAEIEVLEEAIAHLAQSYYAAYECRCRRREEDGKLSGLLQVSGLRALEPGGCAANSAGEGY